MKELNMKRGREDVRGAPTLTLEGIQHWYCSAAPPTRFVDVVRVVSLRLKVMCFRVRGCVLIGAKHEYIMIAKGHVVDHTFRSH